MNMRKSRSGGRAWLGLGAGYGADEAAMTGLPFEPTPERFSRLEELLQLADHMWDGDRSPFTGPHHHLEQPICVPAPVARPRVLIGGMGEQRTLPLVARYADACNLFDVPGRDPAEIEVTLSSRLADGETVPQLADRSAHLARLGVDHLVLVTTGPWGTRRDLDVVLEAAEPLRAVV
jgi:Luciferase-like monooxygenase